MDPDMDEDIASKHSLYKKAGSLQRTSYLHQGKLQNNSSPVSHMMDDGLQQHEVPWSLVTTDPFANEESAPSTSMYYNGEHAHSLSLSDNTDEDFPPHSYLSHHDKTQDPVTVPTPITVVPHLKLEDHKLRRFTNNFVDISPTRTNTVDASPPKPSIESVVSTSSESSLKPVFQQEQSTTSSKIKKGRVIASRYMSATTKTAKSSHTSKSSVTHQPLNSAAAAATKIRSKNKSSSAQTSVSDGFKVPLTASRVKKSPFVTSKSKPSIDRTQELTAVSKQSKGGTKKSAVDGFKIPAVPPSKRSLPGIQQTHNQHAQEDFFQTPVPSLKGISTSTPLQHGGAHDGSYLADFNVLSSAIKASKVNTNKSIDKANHIDDLEMELLYDRLIQLSYMDILSYKALKQQETEAKTQLHQLWRTVMDNKEHCFALAKKVETKERKLATDKALNILSGGLGEVCSKLSMLEQQYGVMAQALDATRHDMIVEGILPLREEEIETELAETEILLGSINASIREKLPEILNFSSSSEAIEEMLDKEYAELGRCYEELSELIRAQVKNTSLNFEWTCRVHN